jgi:hypothetical protein
VHFLRVVPIVEGHGEQHSVRTLLTRVATEIVGDASIDVLRPIRQPRHKIIKQTELCKAITLASSKLAQSVPVADRSFILILLDCDKDLSCELAPRLLAYAKADLPQVDVSCVLAVVEYETWFVACAESLGEFLDLQDAPAPSNPESLRLGKKWVQQRFNGPSYSETQDQPAMTAKMNLQACRSNSPSFDKLCRELSARAP